MSSTANDKTPIQSPTFSLIGQPEVRFEKGKFEALIQRHGYDVYLDKAIKCPCHSSSGEGNLVSCLNCGGVGWVFLNRIKTKMILQSMNIETKFKEWSEEKMGTVKITAFETDEIGFMDRIVVLVSESVSTQLLYPKDVDGLFVAKTRYDIKKISEIFAFDTDKTPLEKLELNTDYNVNNGNIITFNNQYADIENFSVSVRYLHSAHFHVIDLIREVMTVNIRETNGSIVPYQMPVHGVGRRSHYVLDEKEFLGQYLIDNSYEPGCGYSYSNETDGHISFSGIIDEGPPYTNTIVDL